jgi:chromate transporter
MQTPFPYIILATILIGWAGQKMVPGIFSIKEQKEKKIIQEEQYYLNTVIPETGFSWVRLTKQLIVCVILWV